MSTVPERQSAAPKLLAPTSMRLKLAGISLGILALGAAVAPRQAETPLPSPEQGPAPLLGEQITRTTAGAQTFTGVQDVAERARPHAVAIAAPAVPTATLFSDAADVDRPAAPAGFGVYVADGYVLTHARALGGRTDVRLVSSAGVQVDASIAAAEADTGLVLLRVPSGGLPATLAAELPAAGALTVGSGRAGGRNFATAAFVTSVGPDRFSVGAPAPGLTPGLPLFTPAGDLLAVASGTDERGEVFPAAAAVDRLLARASSNTGVFGLVVQDVAPALAPVFGDRGVVVTEAIAGGPAAEAGMVAGDVILALGDAELTSAPAAAAALTSAPLERATTFRILRQGREQSLEVVAIPAYTLAAAPRTRDTGPDARSVMSDEDRRAAGVPADALILRVGSTAVTSAQQARRLLSERRGATAVLLSHDDVRFLVVLPERS